jgi:5-methylthioadenosine/S-adenosylhomocysteine deaminase
MPSVLIDNAFVCAGPDPRPGSVLIDGKRIAAVAFAPDDRAALRLRAAEATDAVGHWLMPGMIDAHAHAYAGVLRGTENSLPLELWSLHTTFHGKNIDGPAMRASVLLGAAERIRAGITGMVDHAPSGHLAEDALAAHEASGLRVAYAAFLHDLSDYDLLDLPLPAALKPYLGGPAPLNPDTYGARFAEIVQAGRAGSGRVLVQLGPNAPQRCSPRAWKLWRDLRERHGVGVHTHLLETRAQAGLNARYDGGLVAAMARDGMLDSGLTCAHGVWLTEAEMDVLARRNVTLSHNPFSNLMLGSGRMNAHACAACGLSMALGNDSANTAGRADHFNLMRLAMTLPRQDGGDPALWPRHAQVFHAATEAGAAAIGRRGEVGRIAAGQLADLVLVRAGAAATLAAEPSVAVLVQHAGTEHVDSVMIDGRWVMRAGRITAFNEDAVLAEAKAQADAVLARSTPNLPLLLAAMPGVAARFLRACG